MYDTLHKKQHFHLYNLRTGWVLRQGHILLLNKLSKHRKRIYNIWEERLAASQSELVLSHTGKNHYGYYIIKQRTYGHFTCFLLPSPLKKGLEKRIKFKSQPPSRTSKQNTTDLT